MERRVALLDLDLRLLRIFQLVVRHNGFSAAQGALGMSQATISAHMKLLEQRLGVRLCERGRSGFFLTEAGRQVHSAMLDLFGSIESFQGAVAAVRGDLAGVLHFGTVDAMYSNATIGLAAALAEFARAAPRVHLEIDIAAPQELARGVMSGRYHVVLSPAQDYSGPVETVDLFDEEQRLYCGRGHPLFAVPDAELTPARLAAHPFAGRSYMSEGPICGIPFRWAAVAAHMEGTALLVSSGAHLAFLPAHFAAQWVARGELRALAPDRFTFDDRFQIALPRKKPIPSAELLVRCLSQHCRRVAS